MVFARRPGTFAPVIHAATGAPLALIDAPPERHFYGHGAIAADGELLLTTANADRTGEGRTGTWHAARGCARLGDMPSGGIGLHDLVLLPVGATVTIANGGIRTHPATGREEVNIATLAPNLAYLRLADGAVVDLVEPPAALRLNSIRHLTAAMDGRIALAMQWQGDPSDGAARLAIAGAVPPAMAAMRGFAGSVAFDGADLGAAMTSARCGRTVASQAPRDARTVWDRTDVSRLPTAPAGWIATDGAGAIVALDRALVPIATRRHALRFDTHLIRLPDST